MENKIPYGDKSFNLDYVTQLIKEHLDAKDPGVKSRNPDYVAKQIIKTRKASRRLRKSDAPHLRKMAKQLKHLEQAFDMHRRDALKNEDPDYDEMTVTLCALLRESSNLYRMRSAYYNRMKEFGKNMGEISGAFEVIGYLYPLCSEDEAVDDSYEERVDINHVTAIVKEQIKSTDEEPFEPYYLMKGPDADYGPRTLFRDPDYIARLALYYQDETRSLDKNMMDLREKEKTLTRMEEALNDHIIAALSADEPDFYDMIMTLCNLFTEYDRLYRMRSSIEEMMEDTYMKYGRCLGAKSVLQDLYGINFEKNDR